MSVFRFLNEGRHGRVPSFAPVEIGTTREGARISLSFDQLQRHVQLIGLSGRGKSRAIEYLLRQFLLNRVGFTLIDPHGDIYEALIHWLTRQTTRFIADRAIHLLDPADLRWRFAYNPLRIPEDTPPELRNAAVMDRVEALMAAVSQVMGGEDTASMPLYQRTFSTVLYTLAERGLTLYESMRILPATEEAFRTYITHRLPDPVAEQTWREMQAWSMKQFTDFMSSLYSRMHRMMRHPFIRQIFGQTVDTLDVRGVMDRGEFVLANFQDRLGFPRANADLLARVLMSDYTQMALSRAANTSRPHFLVIDECYRYLTTDIETILDQTRKFGLHLVLAHQRLSQLGKPGEPIFEGVMEGAQNKLIFGTPYGSALELADRLFAHEYDLERPKRILDKPAVVGVEKVILTGRSESEGTSEAWGASSASMAAAVTSHGFSYDAEGLLVRGVSESQSTSEQKAEGTNAGGGSSSSTSYSEHEAFKPVFETLPTAVYSLADERHRKAVELTTLAQQDVIVRFADLSIAKGKTTTYDRIAPRKERVAERRELLFRSDPCNKIAAEVEAELALRWRELDRLTAGFLRAPQQDDETAGFADLAEKAREKKLSPKRGTTPRKKKPSSNVKVSV